MWITYRKKWKILRPYWSNKLSKDEKKAAEQYKFCTFFKHSLVPKRLRTKFDKELIINNNKVIIVDPKEKRKTKKKRLKKEKLTIV